MNGKKEIFISDLVVVSHESPQIINHFWIIVSLTYIPQHEIFIRQSQGFLKVNVFLLFFTLHSDTVDWFFFSFNLFIILSVAALYILNAFHACSCCCWFYVILIRKVNFHCKFNFSNENECYDFLILVAVEGVTIQSFS